jgi:hypothetical protein
MKREELNRLLEKYYDGNTSEAEELWLRDFFSSGNIPDGYEAEKEIFGFYSGFEKIPEPTPGFEKKILDAVDNNIGHILILKRRRFVFSLVSAAAGVLLLAGTYFFFLHRAEPRDTFSDPQLAYAETLKILYNVSSKINHGTRPLGSFGRMYDLSSKSFEAFDRSTTMVEEKLKNLGYIRKAAEMVSLPEVDSLNK